MIKVERGACSGWGHKHAHAIIPRNVGGYLRGVNAHSLNDVCRERVGLGVLKRLVAAALGDQMQLKHTQQTDRDHHRRDHNLYERDTILTSFHICIRAQLTQRCVDTTLSLDRSHLE